LPEDKIFEKLQKLKDELEICKNHLGFWTNSLDELADIQDAFSTDENIEINLDKATILDIGTDCVKPLYIALKFKPDKIIGIDECLLQFASDIQRKSKLLLKETKIRFYKCGLFNDQKLQQILRKEKINNFDLVLVSKALHHLRTGKCVAKKRDKKHVCKKDEGRKDCIYGFEGEKIFPRLLELGEKVLIYEFFDPNEEDDDKRGGRGGYFTIKELERMFKYLMGKYEVHFIRPQKFILTKQTFSNIYRILKQVDIICFYIENIKVETHVPTLDKKRSVP